MSCLTSMVLLGYDTVKYYTISWGIILPTVACHGMHKVSSLHVISYFCLVGGVSFYGRNGIEYGTIFRESVF